jgi:hypothetical protein
LPNDHKFWCFHFVYFSENREKNVLEGSEKLSKRPILYDKHISFCHEQYLRKSTVLISGPLQSKFYIRQKLTKILEELFGIPNTKLIEMHPLVPPKTQGQIGPLA